LERNDQEELKEGSDEENKCAEEPMEDVAVDISFIDPKEDYFQSIRWFLVNLLDGSSYNVGDLADIIIGQVQVGTLVVNEEDKQEDKNVLAFASILPFELHSKRDSIKSVLKFCLEKAKECLPKEEFSKVSTLLKESKVGLLINERYFNLLDNKID
jgi:hypothetical protein